MKRRVLSGMLLGLLSWTTCGAQAPALDWVGRFPDIGGVAGGIDRPVGMAGSASQVYVGGSTQLEDGNHYVVVQYEVAEHGSGSCSPACGKVRSVAYWPPVFSDSDPTAPGPIATHMIVASESVALPVNDAAVFVTGHMVTPSGFKRVTTAGFDSGLAGGQMRLIWTRVEDDIDLYYRDEIPMAMATYEHGQRVAIVAKSDRISTGHDIVIHVYNGTKGNKLFGTTWTSPGAEDDIPVGVAFLNNDVLIVAGTASAGTDHAKMICLAYDLNTGNQIPGSPILTDNGAQTVVNAVLATNSPSAHRGIQGSHFAIVGTAAPLAAPTQTRIFSAVYNLSSTIPTQLVQHWTTAWPGEVGSSHIDEPLAASLSLVGGGTGEVDGPFHLAVAGSTRVSQTLPRTAVTLYYATDVFTGAAALKWHGWWNRILGSDDYLDAVMIDSSLGAALPRVYVAGATQFGGTNYNYVALKYEAQCDVSAGLPCDGSQRPVIATWQSGLPVWPRTGDPDFGPDIANFTFVGKMNFGASPQSSTYQRRFFLTGRSPGSTSGIDLVTVGYIDEEQ